MSKIISIEGNIGSGKSTLLKSLKEFLNAHDNIVFLQEPVDEWEKIKDKDNVSIITKFYGDQQKYSFAFQMMAYISRLALLKNTIEKYPNAIIITERCLNTDRYVFAKMLYDDKKLEDIEYQIYLNWFDHFLNITSKYEQNNQKVVYLNTEPEICYYRINKRNRNGESNISLKYLQNCHNYHNAMIETIRNTTQILIINSNEDTEKEPNIIETWVKSIYEFIIQ